MPEKAVTPVLVDRQQDAVRHTSGPLLILAGAGNSGSTREQILALTFLQTIP